MTEPFPNNFARRFAELKDTIRDCERCEHYKAYRRDDGSTGYACEHWDCEFTPKGE